MAQRGSTDMLWVGTYAAKGGEGLHPIADGRLEPANSQIVNASWGVWSARTRTAYFVDEQEAGRVTAWTPGPNAWEPRGSCESGGSLPCYLALSPRGDRLAVANYGDGTVTLISVDLASGALGGIVGLARHAGHGPNPERQEGPHAHCVLWDESGERLFHVDLGLDQVFSYTTADGRLGDAEVAFQALPGLGPRHLLLHPDGRHALLLAELASELLLIERTPAGFSLVHSLSTLPEAHEGNLAGHLALGPAGRILVTNRGHDSLAAFGIVGGQLVPDGWVRTGGSSPRHFQVVGDAALVAHEKSGTVALVEMPRADGAGGVARSVPVPGSAFIFEIPDEQWSHA